MSLPQKLPLALLETQWAAQINPIIDLPILQGIMLAGVVLNNGSTIINHKLSRMQQGWIITDQNSKASIYRSAPFNTTTLSLTSDAVSVVNIWVF